MVQAKLSLVDLSQHLELLAEGQDIIARFLPDSIDDLDDMEASREKTLQAARALKELAPYQEKLRAFLIDQKRLNKDTLQAEDALIELSVLQERIQTFLARQKRSKNGS